MINQKNSFNQVQLVQDGKDCVDLHYLQIGQKHHPELESLSPTDKGIGTMSFQQRTAGRKTNIFGNIYLGFAWKGKVQVHHHFSALPLILDITLC